jgi:hypothetical protein
MATFTISEDNNITAYDSPVEAAAASDSTTVSFDSQAAFLKATAEWPLSRLVELWNSIPGSRSVKKFQDRKKAVARIWAAIQPLSGNPEVSELKAGKHKQPAKKAKSTKVQKGAKKTARKQATVQPESGNKKAAVVAMLKKAHGATLAEIMEATGWQAHTVRGFISILGSKGGEKIQSSKNESGERMYRIEK